MKRYGYLIESIAASSNLEWALWRASRQKLDRHDVQRFMNNVDVELLRLQQAILQGELPDGKYRFFTILDPKERTIAVAPFSHRVAHHAIIRQCGSTLDRHQIEQSFACRSGMGQYAAIAWLQKAMRRDLCYLKLDVRKYFDSIDHGVLINQLERVFKDETLLRLWHAIIDNYQCSPGKGLPIGNLTSQYLANHYLMHFDRHVKQTLKIKGYCRYMDDMIVLGQSTQELLALADELKGFLDNRLQLSLKTCYVNYLSQGVSFLGYRVFRNSMRLNRRSKHRFINHWRTNDTLWLNGNVDESNSAVRGRAAFVFAEKANTVKLKSSYIKRHGVLS
jgi:hypothetical protein